MPFVEHPITLSITKFVKLKSSIVYKFFNARWKFNVVIVQSKTEIVQSIFQSSCLNGCFWKYKMFKHSSNEVVSLQIFRELYSWTITFEIYHIIFLVFLIDCVKVGYWCSTLMSYALPFWEDTVFVTDFFVLIFGFF